GSPPSPAGWGDASYLTLSQPPVVSVLALDGGTRWWVGSASVGVVLRPFPLPIPCRPPRVASLPPVPPCPCPPARGAPDPYPAGRPLLRRAGGMALPRPGTVGVRCGRRLRAGRRHGRGRGLRRRRQHGGHRAGRSLSGHPGTGGVRGARPLHRRGRPSGRVGR